MMGITPALAALAAMIVDEERLPYRTRTTGKSRYRSKAGRKVDYTRAKVKAARKQRRKTKP